jgi:uncharacterized Zn finger protein
VVAAVAREDQLRHPVSPGAWDAGVELKEGGLISLRVSRGDRVEALVWDGRAEEVELLATERGLAWRCSCGLSGALGYCSHAVATILVSAERGVFRGADF